MVGQTTSRITPLRKSSSPVSMPALRPRRSAIGARKGPTALAPMAAVTASEMVVRSTPIPRLKAGKKGASMRMGVKITSRQAARKMVCDFMGRTQKS